jgi:hypothetical protein
VPMLTPDDPDSTEGRISHHRFPCRPEIRSFLSMLAEEPRSLCKVKELGEVCPGRRFSVQVYKANEYIGTDAERNNYWADLPRLLCSNSLLFFDPDIGFETKTQNGSKWVRYSEVREAASRLPQDSAVVVYQHRPQGKKWEDVFASVAYHTSYANTTVAAREGNLAFVALTSKVATGNRLAAAVRSYAHGHANEKVSFVDLKQIHADDRMTSGELGMGHLASEAKLKKLVKAAVVEALEERDDLVREAVAEAVEDIGMIRAIQQGARSKLLSRNQVFRILRKSR